MGIERRTRMRYTKEKLFTKSDMLIILIALLFVSLLFNGIQWILTSSYKDRILFLEYEKRGCVVGGVVNECSW